MGSFRHDDAYDHNRILQQLGQAVIETNRLEGFEYRCIEGYPFAWVLHPGLPSEAIVLGYDHLLFLDHLGYIDLQSEGLLPAGRFLLTPAGLARCAELDLFQSSWGSGITLGAPEALEIRPGSSR